MKNKTYTISFLTLVSCGLLFIATFNYLVNPFDIFNSPNIVGFNKNKPESDLRQRLSKAYIVEKRCPENLVMGNSRALAISDNYAAWPNNKTYNYAFTSASIYEIFRYLQHANAGCHIKTVLLSIDILMFEQSTGSSLHFKERRLSVTKIGEPTKNRIKTYLQDSIPALISFAALKASINTLRNQKVTVNNKPHCSSPQKNHQRIINKGGHFNFMAETNKNALQSMSKIKPSDDMHESLSAYKQLLQLAYDKNIRLILFFPPAHASLFETIQSSSYKNRYIKWKKHILKINEELAAALNKKPYTFFDFSGYNSFTTEEIPSKQQIEIGMKWYWESLHFKEELGYHILDRVFDHKRTDCPTADDFGRKISTQNLDFLEAQQKIKRQEYINNHPEISQAIKKWKDEV